MTADQRGRSRKAKYLIPDIGGPGRTSEDASTERVLQFLISGTDASLDLGTTEPTPDTPASTTPTTVKTRSEKAPKKSLAHLFERAGSGMAKNLTLDLPAKPLEPESAPESQATGVDQPSAPGVHSPSPPQTVAPALVASDEVLARYTELWKRFYRLSSGEVSALRSMYQLSHGLGSDQCYVKMHKLANMSNLTYRYCQKVVRNLEKLGWLTKVREYDPADQLGTLYRVNLVNPAVFPQAP